MREKKNKQTCPNFRIHVKKIERRIEMARISSVRLLSFLIFGVSECFEAVLKHFQQFSAGGSVPLDTC